MVETRSWNLFVHAQEAHIDRAVYNRVNTKSNTRLYTNDNIQYPLNFNHPQVNHTAWSLPWWKATIRYVHVYSYSLERFRDNGLYFLQRNRQNRQGRLNPKSEDGKSVIVRRRHDCTIDNTRPANAALCQKRKEVSQKQHIQALL